MKSLEFFDNLLQANLSALSGHDKKWIKRKRKLNTLSVFIFLIMRVGGGLKLGIKPILNKIQSTSSDSAVALDVSGSSMVEVRKKIGWRIFESTLFQVIKAFEDLFDDKFKWKGHRIFAIDGTKLNVPAELKKIKYKKAGPKAYYPMALVSTLFRLRAGIPYDLRFSRHLNEIKDAKIMLRKLKANDVVIYDRNFFSLAMLRTHFENGIHGVFRLRSSSTLKEVVDFVKSGCEDLVLEIDRPNYPKMKIRFLCYRIGKYKYFLGTTLLDQNKYQVKALKALYHERWGIESLFKTFKDQMKIENFSSKSTIGIRQELYTFFFLYAFSTLLGMSRFMQKKKTTQTRRKLHERRTRRHGTKYKMNMTHSIFESSNALITLYSVVLQDDRLQVVKNLVNKIDAGKVRSRPGRSFPRRSHKPVNSWRVSYTELRRKRERLERCSIAV